MYEGPRQSMVKRAYIIDKDRKMDRAEHGDTITEVLLPALSMRL